MLAIGLLGIFFAVGLLVFGVGMQLDERAGIRTSLRRLDGYDIQDTRDQDLLEPFHKRVFGPILQRTSGGVRSLAPAGYLDRARMKLTRAGSPHPDAIDRFLVFKGVAVVSAPVAAFLVARFVPVEGLVLLVATVVAAVAVFLLPDIVLDRRVEKRVHAMRIALPEVIDLLVISVEAGLGFEQAVDRVVTSVPGPLTDEFARMLGEVRAGASRSEALRAMEERLDVQEVRSFILAMLQADTFGISIAKVLRTQAEEMRIKRRQLAQELAQKAPVKMLIPMVFCIFPALFVVVLGPAALDILDAF